MRGQGMNSRWVRSPRHNEPKGGDSRGSFGGKGGSRDSYGKNDRPPFRSRDSRESRDFDSRPGRDRGFQRAHTTPARIDHRRDDRRDGDRRSIDYLSIHSIKAGQKYRGRVEAVKDFGYFVAFGSDTQRCPRDGLLHNDEVDRRLHVRDELEIEVKSVHIDPDYPTGPQTKIGLKLPSGVAKAPYPPYEKHLENRALLILDLNHVLVCRKPYAQRGRGREKPVKRPFLDDFLRFCFSNFAVAVWSCGKRQNMETEIFTEHIHKSGHGPLVFVYEQEQSSNVWPRRSIVSKEKPLFLKDLKKVWDAYPAWNESNTILLDNHLEKFERNPLGTCMTVPDFDVEVPGYQDDEILFVPERPEPQQASGKAAEGPGELVRHLRQMLLFQPAQGGSDTHTESTYRCNAYVLAMQSAAPAYFPSAHPTPPIGTPRGDALVKGADGKGFGGGGGGGGKGKGGASAREAWQAPKSEQPTGNRQRDLQRQLVHDFYASTNANAASNPDAYLKSHRDLMGCHSSPMRRADVQQLVSRRFLVCEKSHGTRYLMYCTAGMTYLVDRTWAAYAVEGGAQIASTLSDFQHPLMKPTAPGDLSILDGELVEVFDGGAEGKGLGGRAGFIYLVFDAILLAGHDVGMEPSLLTRLECVAQAVALFKSGDQSAALQLHPKSMVSAFEAESVLNEICLLGSEDEKVRVTRYGVGTGADAAVVNVMNDGLVFTPVDKPYYKLNMVLKWKPEDELTIDFKLMVTDIRDFFHPPADKKKNNNNSAPTLPLYLSVGRSDVSTGVMSTSLLSQAQLSLLQQHAQGASGGAGGGGRGGKGGRGQQDQACLIVECNFEPSLSSWRMHRVRTDKNRPNSMATAWKNLEVVSEAFSGAELVKSLRAQRAAAQANGGANGATATGRGTGVAPLSIPPSNAAVATLAATPTSWEDRATSTPLSSAAPAFTPRAQQQPTSMSASHTEAQAREAAAHYDQRQQLRNSAASRDELDQDIRFVRRVDNWVKAVLINRWGKGSGFAETAASAPLVACACPEALLFPSASKGRGRGRGGGGQVQDRTPIRVLDLACGRGGDLLKWTAGKELYLHRYVGVDVSAEALEEARRRVADMFPGPKSKGGKGKAAVANERFHFLCSDIAASGLLEEYKQDQTRQQQQPEMAHHMRDKRSVPYAAGEPFHFDVVSVQFALHYVCNSPERIDTFFANTRRLLGIGLEGATGGGRAQGRAVLATVPDYRVILQKLREGKGKSFGNRVYNVERIDTGKKSDAGAFTEESIAADPWGVEYKFTLGDAVVDCAESLVYLPAVDAVARRHGMQISSVQNLSEFVSDQVQIDEYRQMLTEMKVLPQPKAPPITDDEWEVIQFYCLVVFTLL